MSHLRYYEAPQRFDLDGFVDPVDLPTAIRLIAPPNAKSTHALAGAICRSLGADRDLYTQATGETIMLSSATAWSLAIGITDVYIAASEDLKRDAIFDCIYFAGRIGANLHLVFSFGQVNSHADTINEAGFESTAFATLPQALRTPAPMQVAASRPAVQQRRVEELDLPDDHWTSFRAAYLSALPHADAALCDAIYLNAYDIARNSKARTSDEVAALAGSLWQQFGISETERTVACRALQAALFRTGLIVRIELGPFTRHVQQRYVNLMTAEDYTALQGFVNPWRAAATVLHAHHVSTEVSVALRVSDVTRDGDIPHLGLNLPSEARTLLAAQRWHQLLTQDNDPPLFKEQPNPLRRGIRKVITELELPLIPYWRTLADDKGRTNWGIKVEEFA